AAGSLGFRRGGKVWEEFDMEYRQPPKPLPLPQPKIVPATDYNEWARCQSCGSQRFSPFTADKVYFACDGCVGETDRRVLGAPPVEAGRPTGGEVQKTGGGRRTGGGPPPLRWPHHGRPGGHARSRQL